MVLQLFELLSVTFGDLEGCSLLFGTSSLLQQMSLVAIFVTVTTRNNFC